MNPQYERVQLVLPTFALFDASLHACVCLKSRDGFLYIIFCFEFIETCVLACAHHLASFYVLVELLSDNPLTCISRFRSLDIVDPLDELLCTVKA